MTIAKYVAEVYGESLSEHEIDYMLRNETAWPFCGLKILTRQIGSFIRARRHKIERCWMCAEPTQFCKCDPYARSPTGATR